MIRKIFKWVLLLALLVGIFIGMQVWHETSVLSRLVERGFSQFKVSDMAQVDLPQTSAEAASLLQKADLQFERQEWKEAIITYRLLQQQHPEANRLARLAQWHECLALYHSQGSNNPSFRKLLDNLAESESTNISQKARDLRSQLDNFYVGLAKG